MSVNNQPLTLPATSVKDFENHSKGNLYTQCQCMEKILLSGTYDDLYQRAWLAS